MKTRSIAYTRVTPELLMVARGADPLAVQRASPLEAPPRARTRRPWLLLAILAVLATLAGIAVADEPPDELGGELPAEPAWDPETRGSAVVNTSTATPNGLRFGMELTVGLATRPVVIDAAGPNGGKIVVTTTGRWKAAAGTEKIYAVILERLDGTRWLVVEARRAKVGADRVRNEWPVRGRGSYRVTVMARKKGVSGPLLRVNGEVRTIVHR